MESYVRQNAHGKTVTLKVGEARQTRSHWKRNGLHSPPGTLVSIAKRPDDAWIPDDGTWVWVQFPEGDIVNWNPLDLLTAEESEP